ncbi:MAG: arsenate reductase ArsC [Bacteroidales bacterium]|nr:arsenate reductase ArsC [Bacteroidales bacterium]
MKKVLVLCTGNSCRSQMAEGWIKHFAGDMAEVYSAGLVAHGLNPYAVAVMKDAGIDISGYKSKTIKELPDIVFDYIISLCNNVKEKCPEIPGKAIRIHKPFDDPAEMDGSSAELMKVFTALRNSIENFCFDFVNNNIRRLLPDDPDQENMIKGM